MTYLGMIDALPISEERKQIIRVWAFEGAAQEIMKETAARLDAMQAAFGLMPVREAESGIQGQGEGETVQAPVGQGASSALPRVEEAAEAARSRNSSDARKKAKRKSKRKGPRALPQPS
jgi:hypothetical protein